MTTYALHASRFTTGAQLQATCGELYHLGLSGTFDGTTYYYGYILEPDSTKNGGFRQRSDTATKDALINYSSGNLIDRDLAFFPRVTDGDFSGGGYQEVWLQTNKYFDSDLDPRIPGYLELAPQWARFSKPGLTLGGSYSVVTWKGDFWFTFGEANGNVYSGNGGTTTIPVAAVVKTVMTDGRYLYAGTGAQLYRSLDGLTWTQVTAALNVTASYWWIVNQGTNGYFAYYGNQTPFDALYKIDLTLGFPIAAAAQPQVPTGANAIDIVDICPYQSSIAILTIDLKGSGCDVWYHDGTNLTRIVRLEGYFGRGICNALGELYVGAYAAGQITSPILARIGSGTFDIVARPGSPFPTAGQDCSQPQSSSQYVYWPIIAPSIKGISSAPGMVLRYDVLTGAVSHLPNLDTTDLTTLPDFNRHTVATMGDNVAFIYSNGTTGIVQYQRPAFGTINYSSSGWLVSSHIDFATPGIHKRLRRIEVHHAPLAVGEAIQIMAFVDTDPLAFTTSLTPVPSTATVTNSTVGTSLTAMTFGQDTIGKTMYFALKLTSGSGNLSTPRVSYVSIEVGGTWAWEVTLACTSKRGLLDGQSEETQPTGKDLSYLLWLAYEQGQTLTLYHRNGQSYTVAIESLELWNPSPLKASQPQQIRDEENFAHVFLRQVA